MTSIKNVFPYKDKRNILNKQQKIDNKPLFTTNQEETPFYSKINQD